MIWWVIAALCAYIAKGLTGFANTLLFSTILSFGNNNISISPVELILGYPTNVIMAWKERKSIQWDMCIPLSILMLIGNIPGVFMLKAVNPQLVKIIFGFVISFIGIEMLLNEKKVKKEKHSKLVMVFVGLLAGVMCGLYGIGALLAVYLGRVMEDTKAFKANLCVVFLAENTFRIFAYTYLGIITADIVKRAVVLLPCMIIGLFIGMKSCEYLNEKTVKKLIIITLIISGMSLIVSNLGKGSIATAQETPQLISEATICVGKRAKLKVTGTNKTVTWSSSNKKIVKISRKGSMVGVKKGTATITAKVGKRRLDCNVKVTEAVPKATTKLVIENVGGKGISYYSNEIYCKSSDKEIATVAVIPANDGEEGPYEKGADIMVYGHKSGTAIITITNDCNKEKVKFKVTVKKPEIESPRQKLVDYVLRNGRVEEDSGDKVISRRCNDGNANVAIWYNPLSGELQYEYKEKNSFGTVKWLLMDTEKDNTEAYIVLWLYPAGSKEEYYVTSVIDTKTYQGENLVFEDGWYGITAQASLQGIANEGSQKAVSAINSILKTEVGEQEWIQTFLQ